MRNSGNENEAKGENDDEQRRGASTSKTTVTNRSKVKDAPNATTKKTKYDKLWVPKTGHTSSSHSSTKAKVKKTPLPSVTKFNCLKGSRESETETETQKVTNFESFHDALPGPDKIDVSTQTVERPSVDVSISCACEIADQASGPNIPIEYRCSTKSVATTDQWDQRLLSRPDVIRDESRYSRDREEFLWSPGSLERFSIEPETSWARDSHLIYDEESHSHKILLDKPKYVTTCESFGQSTDKSLSISHDFFDAAVGSSIIIEDNGKNVSTATERSHDEKPRKSVHCEVCTACRELLRGPTIPERTSKPSQFECSTCTNDRPIRDDRNRKRNAFSTSSEYPQDFISNPQNISESVISRSNNVRKDTREKSAAAQETSIAELKSSRSSKNNRSSNDSMAFWHDNAKARNINEPWNSRPLHESTKLNLESINDFHRGPLTFPDSRGSQPRNEQIKLATALSRSNKNYPEEREINVRTCDFDEVILRRRYKPRSHDVVRPREKESTRKYPIVDKLEPLSNRDSDNPLAFNLKELNQVISQDRDKQRKFLSGCRFSEINNFGKIYDWNKPMEKIVDEILRCEAPGKRKAWKSSNGSVARNNKCHCHN